MVQVVEQIVEEREEKMVTPSGKNPTLRIARFLKPSVTCIDQADGVHFSAHKQIFNWPSKVNFNGWKFQQRKWKEWVDQMTLLYEPIWKQAGIYDAIISTTYEIRKDKELVLGLTECWCPDTNTFIFPWGEATLTLEDMLILGGFSVIGEPVTRPLTGELLEIEEKIAEEHYKFWKYKVAKPCHSEWIKRFRNSNSELEHIAFLCLWLSRYVLPTYPNETICKEIFPIAIQLSHGTRIALAPAVLASLYRDLRVLKQHFVVASVNTTGSSSSTNDPCLSLWAPFQIMQLWAWEHFPSLRLEPNFLDHNMPRAARWHQINKISSKLKIELVRSTMSSIENFVFRPYSRDVDNWTRPSYYCEDQGGWVLDSKNLNEELQSFCHSMMTCELLGLNCIEQYLPHRVCMQFGMDQDLPGHFTRANANRDAAWMTYIKPNTDVLYYRQASDVQPKVTHRYFEWWNQCLLARQDLIHQNVLLKHKKRSIDLEKLPDDTDENESEGHVSPPSGISRKRWECKNLRDDNDDRITLSQRLKHFKDQDATTFGASASNTHPLSSTDNNVDEIAPLPGIELEARLGKLEEVMASLKESFTFLGFRTLNGNGPSDA